MPRLSRRFALTPLSLALALVLAAPPAQAGQSPPLGWLDAVAQQLAQWTASWWAWPTTAGRSSGQAQHPAKSPPSKLRIDCGILIEPDGGCPGAASHPVKSPPVKLRIDCGIEIDPNGKCLLPAPAH
ncbi:MAG TPA: hypothetical protein VMW75_08300 [Thermoanaerobaculia bacterium]|nr:hypothetical protein [Thermoanaerobaculia bacterium]